MGIISTSDIKEYKKDNTLIFISKRELKFLNSIKEIDIVRCDNQLCRQVLPPTYQATDDYKVRYHTYLKDKKGNYCDKWCKEQAELRVDHPCKYCGIQTEPIRVRNKITGYRITCDDCMLAKKEERKLKKKKVRAHVYNKDNVGHTCKKCGEYKVWDLFPTNRGKYTHRCKECRKEDQLEYYHKNKNKINEKKKNKFYKII